MRAGLRAVAAVVLVLALGAVAAPASTSVDSQRQGSADEPRGLSDPRPAVEGTDYHVLAEIDPAVARRVIAIPDKRRLLLDDHRRPSLGLLDLTTGRTQQVPRPWGKGSSYLGPHVLDDEVWISWRAQGRLRGHLRVLHLDAGTGDYKIFTSPAPAPRGTRLLSGAFPDASGRLYYLTGKRRCPEAECNDPRKSRLWSFRPGARKPTLVVKPVAFGVSGRTLAWVDKRDRTRLRIRDLVTKDEHSYTPERCRPTDLLVSDAAIISNCVWDESDPFVLSREGQLLHTFDPVYTFDFVGHWMLTSGLGYDTRNDETVRFFNDDYHADSDNDLMLVPRAKLYQSDRPSDRVHLLIRVE